MNLKILMQKREKNLNWIQVFFFKSSTNACIKDLECPEECDWSSNALREGDEVKFHDNVCHQREKGSKTMYGLFSFQILQNKLYFAFKKCLWIMCLSQNEHDFLTHLDMRENCILK